MGRILAIDYGRKRVGFAVTDELQIIATPLATISAHNAIQFLKEYTSENRLDCFVIGEPKQMNNQPSESEKYIGPFIRLLKKEFQGITVYRMDERLTSQIAAQTIREAGLKKKDRQNKSLVDTVSAVLILQSYMESKNKLIIDN